MSFEQFEERIDLREDGVIIDLKDLGFKLTPKKVSLSSSSKNMALALETAFFSMHIETFLKFSEEYSPYYPFINEMDVKMFSEGKSPTPDIIINNYNGNQRLILEFKVSLRGFSENSTTTLTDYTLSKYGRDAKIIFLTCSAGFFRQEMDSRIQVLADAMRTRINMNRSKFYPLYSNWSYDYEPEFWQKLCKEWMFPTVDYITSLNQSYTGNPDATTSFSERNFFRETMLALPILADRLKNAVLDFSMLHKYMPYPPRVNVHPSQPWNRRESEKLLKQMKEDTWAYGDSTTKTKFSVPVDKIARRANYLYPCLPNKQTEPVFSIEELKKLLQVNPDIFTASEVSLVNIHSNNQDLQVLLKEIT